MKLIFDFRFDTFWYTWHNLHDGGRPDQPHPPELKFLIWLLSGSDQCSFILWYKLSFLWKFEPDTTTLRGVLDWFAI